MITRRKMRALLSKCDVVNVDGVAKLLGVSTRQVRRYFARPDNPLRKMTFLGEIWVKREWVKEFQRKGL